jgi:hypothetical protein
MEPKRGMVYDVLVHILSVVVMRRHGPDGRPLFYPFHFNPGATNADQAVAPEPAPIEPQAVAVSGAEEQLPRAPAPPRNSCSAEYWRPHHRDHNNDDDDEDGGDGRGGRAFAPQRRSLFQRLRWPADKGRSRERSPWLSRRSNRLASKTMKRDHKTAEEMAQELLCKKLDPNGPAPGKDESTEAARARLSKPFDATIPKKAMEAIEDLLKVLNLEGKIKAKPGKKSALEMP